MKHLISSFLFVSALLAQEGQQTRISPAPVDQAFTTITHFTGSLPDYVCKARSTQDVATITVSAISNANPGVMTATAHGFYFDAGNTGNVQKFVVFISGLTGNWTPLNGIQVVFASSANALTTAVNTTAFGAVTGTPVVSTRAPKATANVWSVSVTAYDSNNNPRMVMWPVPTTGTTLQNLQGGQTSFAFPCAVPTAYQ
jgi:hypothetical protein